MAEVCSACGKKVDMTMSFSASGPGITKREPTPPICGACFKKRSAALLAKLRGKK